MTCKIIAFCCKALTACHIAETHIYTKFYMSMLYGDIPNKCSLFSRNNMQN